MRITRREAAIFGGAAILSGCAGAPAAAEPDAPFADIETRLGGRLGVCAIDAATGMMMTNRANDAFAMCSTFKWLLAAGVLNMAGHGGPQLDDKVLFSTKDLLAYAPVTRAMLEDPGRRLDGLAGVAEAMIGELCEAAVTVSDNTAANLLLEGVMGPQGLTYFLRSNGDGVTRLDRREPELNENAPGDPRDTTTPHAMARTLLRFLHETDVLSAPQRDRLIDWMIACSTGLDRLRAGLPDGWIAGDKTGTGGAGAHNDVAIVWPEGRAGRAPIAIASYISESSADAAAKAAAHAEVARRVAERFGR
ncbi:MAG: class A beta-lactamase [Hyphomonadaceae bacterium]